MISVYKIKPAFQNLLRVPTRALAKTGVTANQVTVAAMLLSIAVGILIYLFPQEKWPLILLGPFLLVRMALNAIDGMLAREHDMKSALGAFLNELGDIVSDIALYLPLAVFPGFDPVLVVLAVCLLSLTEAAGLIAAQIGTERRYDGPMGKSDRALVIGITTMCLGCGVPSGNWLTGLFTVLNVLMVYTVINRVKGALKEAE